MKLQELKENYEIRKEDGGYQPYRILSARKIGYLGYGCRTLKEARDQCRGDADQIRRELEEMRKAVVEGRN